MTPRSRTFPQLRAALLERLASRPELAALTTRAPDDPAIAVLEQWAALAEVLAFYAERYAGEAHVDTAVRAENIRRLARLVGHRPAPAVSATTTLTFTATAGEALTVPAGFAVQSVPGPGEQPQTYETAEDCAVDWRRNALPVVGAAPAAGEGPGAGPESRPDALVRLDAAADLAARLRRDDAVLFVAGGTPGSVRPATIVDVAAEHGQLRLVFSGPPGAATVYVARRALPVFGHDAPAVGPPVLVPDAGVPGNVRWSPGQPTGFGLPAGSTVPLDRRYPDLAVGARLLVAQPGGFTRVVRVTAVGPGTQELAGRTDMVTVATVDGPLPAADRRTLAVVELGDEVPLRPAYPASLGTLLRIPGLAVEDPGRPGAVRVVGARAGPTGPPVVVPGDLPPGRLVVLTDAAGAAVAATIQPGTRRVPAGVGPGRECHLEVGVTAAPDELARLDAAGTWLLGNAAPASHGATVSGEVLGDGDASAAFARFPLARAPLCWVPTADAAGSAPAIRVCVDAVAYRWVDSLVAAGAEDEVYTLVTEADGRTSVQFGDGANGARPRSGKANIVATYRYGAGLAGRVAAATLTQPRTRLAGLESVTNPVPARGGADPDGAAAPALGAVRLLDRAVSADDCAQVLVASGRVAKAEAVALVDGRGPLIAVTVAAPAAATFDAAGRAALAAVVSAAGPPYRRITVVNYRPVAVAVSLAVAPARDADARAVEAAVRASVASRLSFDRVGLGRPLYLSDVYLAAYAAAGVGAVTVTRFGRRDGGAGAGGVPDRLPIGPGGRDARGTVFGAELPVLADADLAVTPESAPSRTGGP